jgi:hypothetical protein
MDNRLGGSMWNCVRNARYTAVTDSFFVNCRTHQLLCCVGNHFQNWWHLAEARNNNNHPGHLKQNFKCFSIDWCRCEARSPPHLFYVSFWKCKVLLCSPCIMTLHNSTTEHCSNRIADNRWGPEGLNTIGNDHMFCYVETSPHTTVWLYLIILLLAFKPPVCVSSDSELR